MTAFTEQRKNLARGRIPMPKQSHANTGEVIENFVRAIGEIEHVRVIAATPESALAGLKDQVLQRSPGRKKDGVKTGASDSTWLRDVLAAADGSAEQLLFLTQDKDIRDACQAWGIAAPLTRTRRQLRSTLFEVTIDDGHATRAVVRYLLEQLPIGLSPGDQVTRFDIGNTPSLDRAVQSSDLVDALDAHVLGASVTRLTALAGLDRVTVESDPADTEEAADTPRGPGDLGSACHHQVSATVFFLADAQATIDEPFQGVDFPPTRTLEYQDAFVRADLIFHLTDGVITGVSSQGDAYVSLPDLTYAEPEDALQDIREALSCVPGLTVPDDLESRRGEHLLKVKDSDAGLTLTWRSHDNWAFTLELRNGDEYDYFEVSCEYNVDAWVGGKDGFHMADPYYLVVEEGDLSPHNPLWSMPAWIIQRLDWSTE
ncbi:hypothetical protein [Acrocarpospora catenulata]|uniref:hypothetical protein n=1 Tax=Acrocarpospora catenulata TaxID=2836182 RepID=UPI001BD9B680|nr:hypothetical protein [Acrocarpospora catenulata]